MSVSYGGSSQHGGSAADITPRLNRMIWLYFIVIGFLLYLLIAALTIFFHVEVEREGYEKFGSVKPRELIELRQQEDQILRGEKGLMDGKKHTSIDDAMDRYLALMQKRAN